MKDNMHRIEDALADFVVRVAQKENATPEELAALPEVAKSITEIHGWILS